MLCLELHERRHSLVLGPRFLLALCAAAGEDGGTRAASLQFLAVRLGLLAVAAESERVSGDGRREYAPRRIHMAGPKVTAHGRQ